MKIVPVFILLINLFSFYPDSANRNVSGFRDSNWGNSISDVITKEVASRVDSQKIRNFTILIYKDRIAEINANIYYGFNKNKLLFGVYKFMDDHTGNAKEYFNDYNKIKNIISKQYTLPTKDEWVTQNNKVKLYRENEKLAESALALGLLELKSTWILNGGSIILTLKQENGIFLKVRYISEAFFQHYNLPELSFIDRNNK